MPAGKQFYVHLILILNLLKVLTILFLIFLQENSCKERVTQIFLCRNKNEFQQEQEQERQRQSNTKSWRLSASNSRTKSICTLNINPISAITIKIAVTNPASSSSTNDYMIRFTEHLLLTSCKPPPPTNIISSIIQKLSVPTNSLQMISVSHKNSMS